MWFWQLGIAKFISYLCNIKANIMLSYLFVKQLVVVGNNVCGYMLSYVVHCKLCAANDVVPCLFLYNTQHVINPRISSLSINTGCIPEFITTLLSPEHRPVLHFYLLLDFLPTFLWVSVDVLRVYIHFGSPSSSLKSSTGKELLLLCRNSMRSFLCLEDINIYTKLHIIALPIYRSHPKRSIKSPNMIAER